MSYSLELFRTASRSSFLSVYDFLHWFIKLKNFGNEYVPCPEELSLYRDYEDYCYGETMTVYNREIFSNELTILGHCCGEVFFPKRNGVKMIAVRKLKTFYGLA
jgi:hypothetical protein